MSAVKSRLKPCPFCGYKEVYVRVYEADGIRRFRRRYSVLCDYSYGGCGSESGHYYTPEEAVVMWNQRRRKWRE